MSTLSVPLPDDMLKSINKLIKEGVVPNKAEAVRQAVRMYLEHQAVQEVLKAAKEPRLEGDLDELAKKF
jgi:Arc/MetJ-type ribon-helix-helix transcriptional regulator